MKHSRRKTPKQYSKTWMTRWQVFVMFWLSIFFVADIYYNSCSHLEALCITLVTSIIGCVIPYFAKSYLETKEERLLKYKYTQLENQYEQNNNCNTMDDEYVDFG